MLLIGVGAAVPLVGQSTRIAATLVTTAADGRSASRSGPFAIARASERMVQQLGDGTVHLRRSLVQRGFGWFMAVTSAVRAAGFSLVAVGPWTFFTSDPGPVKWFLLVVAPLVTVTAARTTAAALRLATTPRGAIRLDDDGITVIDPSVLREPLRIARSEVATISPAPTGTFAYRVSGAAAKEGAALLSLYAERPNVLLKLAQPRVLEMARWNHGLQGNYALRAPSRKKAVRGLWLRTEDEAGRDLLLSWSS